MDAAAWDSRYAGSELIWSAEPNRFVAAELGALPPGRAAELDRLGAESYPTHRAFLGGVRGR